MGVQVGIVMLVHQDLDRAAQVACHWAENGCPVAIHVDSVVSQSDYDKLLSDVAGFPQIRFSDRRRCEWGQFSIVEATQSASELILEEFPEVTHVFLTSGSCIPLRPIESLTQFLRRKKRTDFIESVTTEEVTWTVGGLDLERFTLRFPFSWKRSRYLFDKYTDLQRKIGYSRAIPDGIEPHLGSQWWCLTRQTLSAILEDPDRPKYDKYFRKVWIPDEAYFQTLTRKYSANIESRSLTLSKFDHLGRPHIFYDDHMQLLRRSDCFVARKIWPDADLLYKRFLSDELTTLSQVQSNPRKLDRIFAKAVDQRSNGRPGLTMQSRFPKKELWGLRRTCAEYSVYQGFGDIFENFETWLEKRTGARVHGHLFHKSEVKYSGGAEIYNGCLSKSAKLRDYNPEAFMSNLIWNTQGEHQSFQFGPSDAQNIGWFLANDPNATISVVTGAWAIPLFHSNMNFSRIRRIAARYQKTEAGHLAILRSHQVRAKVRLWTLSEFVEDPMPILQSLIDDLDPRSSRRLTEVPRMMELEGFGQFVQNLRNRGMNPHLIGDFPLEKGIARKKQTNRPYVVR